ncbi:DNA-binding response regulator [Adhaeribacter arboris]|uniref:DNA-binding response regulator n=1 Tax=Adhaeribacter arboris TaxID=2072846 RepID=A0A2T2Y8Q8_9BACT|nr:response regulator [Adhaeribacter arboris]PSR51912.1 DNA-binding response regulator [Adhaeribacter arboris]
MIRAIIVDDELHCVELLQWQLNKYFPQVQVLASCNSGKEAIPLINERRPDLVFLDIEMPQMNGFEMLQSLPRIDFDIVFTTAYDQFAIRAIKFSALDYLLKPIDKDELQAALIKINTHPARFISTQQLDLLLSNMQQVRNGLQKIALPTLQGYEMVYADQIVRCESDSNYTSIFLKNGSKIIVSKTLKEVEEMLENHHFFRVHHSHMVNLNEVIKYVKGDGGYLLMSDNSAVSVARSRKDALLRMF